MTEVLPTTAVRIRTALAQDLADVQAIYAHHVLTGLASFEEEPPDSYNFV